ncbi:MAG: YbbR-like domain-containing protein [Prolixibacteraceae bacterium]|nr:YbbR-like domain-containing protein [Prolixibacteraceae bacterium]
MKRIVKPHDRRVVIYLICVGIATVFWLLNMLGKEYTADIELPVRYTNLPANKVLINDLPQKFTLHANAFGFTLLRHKLSLSFSPLIFSVNDFTRSIMETGKKPEYIILTESYLNDISAQLSSDVKVLDISPDTLRFNFDQIIQKKVKVYPHVQVEPKQQYQLSGSIRTNPDSVLVSGPRSLLDTLKQIFTRYQYFKSVSEDIREDVPLVGIANLEIREKQVKLQIPVEEFTESQMLIPLSVENKPDSINLKIFPNKVKVSFLVGLSRYSEILPSDFELVVSWDEAARSRSMLKVEIRSVPPFVKSVKIAPEEVEYLIEK